MRRILALLLLATACACGSPTDTGGGTASQANTAATPTPSFCEPGQNDIVNQMEKRTSPPPTIIEPSQTYLATVQTARGNFVIALDQKAAPVTVNNFVCLAQDGFYAGLTFHRVIADFVVQGGDPLGNGTGGLGYNLPDETNAAPWLKNSVGMASSKAGISACQFFVLTGDATYLSQSGSYNHFGTVVSGMDVVTQIQQGDKITGITIGTA